MHSLQGIGQLKHLTGPTAAGTSAIASAEVDTAGFGGVVFFCTIAVDAAGNYMTGQQDVATGMASAADLLGSKVLTADTDEVAILDVHRPLERFVRARILRGTSTALGDIYALLYEPRASASAILAAHNLVRLLSPAEGTP